MTAPKATVSITASPNQAGNNRLPTRIPIHLPRLLLMLGALICVFALLVPTFLRDIYAQTMAETEPNNTLGTANVIQIGAAVQGTIAPAGDVDWFAFRVDHQGELRVAVTNVAAELAVNFRVWNADWQTVSSWYVPLAPGGDTTGIVDLPRGGMVYLEVAAGDNRQESGQLYTLQLDFLESPDLFEPNNRFGDAAPLHLGESVAATIFPAGDVDWYAVRVDHHGELTLRITDVPDELVINVRVYTANRDTLTGWFSPLAPGGDTVAVVDLPAPGSYYLELAAADNRQRAIEPYTLSTQFVPSADLGEPNNTFGAATALELGRATPATILPAGDVDWYSFDVSHHGELRIALTEVPAALAVNVRVWTANRDTLTGWFTPLAVGGETHAVVDLPAPGRYYLETAAADNRQRAIEPFLVRADFTPATDPFEPNNTVGAATPLGLNRTIESNILPAGDVDWFVTETNHHGELRVTIDQVPETLAVRFRVWTANRDTLTSWFAPLAMGGATQGIVDLPRPGRYFIEVAADSNQQRDIRPFRMTTVFQPAADPHEPNNTRATAAPVNLDETFVGNILPAGDVDWYVFQTPAPGDLHVALLNTAPELAVRFRLVNVEGQTITNWFAPLALGGNIQATIALEAAGTYYLEVADNDGRARAIAPYAIRLSMSPIDMDDLTPVQAASGSDTPVQPGVDVSVGADAQETTPSEGDKLTVLTSAVVGSAGASLIVNSTGDYRFDGARLQVGPDSVDAPVTVSVAVAADPESGAPLGLFPAGVFWRLSPGGIRFQQPVTLTLPLPPGASPGDAYFVGHWNGTEWVDLGGEIEHETIRATTDSFSTFGVFCGAFDQYRPVRIVNASTAPIVLLYAGGPAPIPDDPATQYATNCRPPMGAEASVAIAQGKTVPFLLRAGAYVFDVVYTDTETNLGEDSGAGGQLLLSLPTGAGAQTITIGDEGATSDDPATTLTFAGRLAQVEAAAVKLPPALGCSAVVPEGVALTSLDPTSPLPARFVRIGPLRTAELPPLNMTFALEALATDPEGSLLRPYWTFGYPGTLPAVGQPVASGTVLGRDIQFSPTQAGLYRIFLTVYDADGLFDECRWDILVEPNSKPNILVFTGRTHVEFGRLDNERQTVGDILPVPMPHMPPVLTVPSLIPGAPSVSVDAFTHCPADALGPFAAAPDMGTLVSAPAPLDTRLAPVGPDVTPRWPLPGRTCVWAVPYDADEDDQFVRWEFPLPYFGAGTFYAAIGVPAGFHPDAPDGIEIGRLLRTAQQLNAYNAFVSTLYNSFGVVPAMVWEAWDDPCLAGDGTPINPCETALSGGGVTNLVAHTTDGFAKEQLGYAAVSVGPEGFQSDCANVFFMTLTPMPANPDPGQAVVVRARVSPEIENCPIVFSVVGTDGYQREVIIRTNKSGEAHFTIPGASQGTVDVVTATVVKIDEFGVVDTGVEFIRMEVTYQF